MTVAFPPRAARAALLALLLTTGSAAAQSVTLPGPADPPEPGPGMLLRFGISATPGIATNRALDPQSAGDTSYLENRLSFGLLSETAVSRLQFDIAGILRWSDMPVTGSDSGFDGPEARLSWRHEGAGSRLDISGYFQRADMNFFDPLSLDEIGDGDLINDRGTREAKNFGLNYEFGRDAPLGGRLRVSHARRDFTDTTDPDLFATRDTSVLIGGRMQLSPLADLRLDLSQADYRAEDLVRTDRTTRNATLGLNYDISAMDRIEAQLGYQQMETWRTRAGLRGEETDDGVTGGLVLRRERPDGEVSLALNHSITQNGGRSTLRLGQVRELPTGALSGDIGFGRNEGGDPVLIGALDWRQDLPRGSVTLGVGHELGINSNDRNTETTALRLSWLHEVGPLSQIALDADYAASEVEGGEDIARGTLRLAWEHRLARDWGVSSGVEHRYLDEEFASGSAGSNAVFVTLARVFEFRR